MESNSKPALQFDSRVLEQLACPACLGGLSFQQQYLLCGQCGRAYPVVDGIPVLIAERAEPGGFAPMPRVVLG
jgi:uncharacterized protein YbaR (Trm112 family)